MRPAEGTANTSIAFSSCSFTASIFTALPSFVLTRPRGVAVRPPCTTVRGWLGFGMADWKPAAEPRKPTRAKTVFIYYRSSDELAAYFSSTSWSR